MVSPMKHLLILAVLFLTSCAMSKEEIALENQKLALMKAVADKPTLRCEQGCEYTDPRRNLSAMFPKETNGWDFGNNVLDTLKTATPWLVLGDVAKAGLRAAGNNTTNNDSYKSSGGNTTNGAIDNSVVTGAVDSSSTDSNDNNSTVNTDSNDNNSTTDSNDNNSNVDSNDNNSTDDNSTVTPEVTPVIPEATP